MSIFLKGNFFVLFFLLNAASWAQVPVFQILNKNKSGLKASWNTDALKQIDKKKPNSFKTVLNFLGDDHLITLERLKYTNQLTNTALIPIVYTASVKGKYLINLSIGTDVVLKYHSPLGNKTLTKDKKGDIVWTDFTFEAPKAEYCGTSDIPIELEYYKVPLKSNDLPEVKVYVEIDHHTYNDFDQDINTINTWTAALFAEIASIYAMEGITIVLDSVMVWNTIDPYHSMNNSKAILDTFSQDYATHLTGDVGLFLSTRYFGGYANLEALCPDENGLIDHVPAAVASGIFPSFERTNNYEYSTFVVSHELGHVLGSRHTHACVWIDGSQALDNCAIPEGNCSYGPNPGPQGGTIMSYCHNWTHIGINFSNGFGSEPAQLIKSYIANSICLSEESSICLIDSPCDDGNICTMNDRYINNNCECSGVLIDFNMNGVCDLDDNCPEIVMIDTISLQIEGHIAQQKVMSNSKIENGQTVYFSAGQEIILDNGFEVNSGAIFESQLFGCNDD